MVTAATHEFVDVGMAIVGLVVAGGLAVVAVSPLARRFTPGERYEYIWRTRVAFGGIAVLLVIACAVGIERA